MDWVTWTVKWSVDITITIFIPEKYLLSTLTDFIQLLDWSLFYLTQYLEYFSLFLIGAGRSSEVERSLMGEGSRRIDPSWAGPIELFLVPASAPQLV